MIRTGKSNPIYKDDFLENIPELYDKQLANTAVSAFVSLRMVVCITKDGVSPIRSYKEIPMGSLYGTATSFPGNTGSDEAVLEAQLTNLTSNTIHPHTGDVVTNPNTRVSLFWELQKQIAEVEEQKVNTHFQDYVENLTGDDGEVDKDTSTSVLLLVTCVTVTTSSPNNVRWFWWISSTLVVPVT